MYKLTGSLPFNGAPLPMLLTKQHTAAPSPSSLVATLPRDLDALCTRMLATAPNARPTCAEALEVLEKNASGSIAAAASGVRPASKSTTPALYQSAAGPTSRSKACSGAMYAGVPTCCATPSAGRRRAIALGETLRSVFSATRSRRAVSKAWYTTPIPPSPSSFSIRKRSGGR